MADPVSWLQIEQGWNVVASDGAALGTVAQVAGDKQSDIFDGLAVAATGSDRVLYAPGEIVGGIFPGEVHLTITGSAAEALTPYQPAAPERTFRADQVPLKARLFRWLGGKR